MYSKYDREEFEGIGDMEKTSHSMKDPLIIHTVNQAYCLNFLRMKSAGYMLSAAVCCLDVPFTLDTLHFLQQ